MRRLLGPLALALALAGAAAGAQEQVSVGTGAILRTLDKVTGQVRDLDMRTGGRAPLGRIVIEMRECRYPAGDPAGDAFAFIEVREEGQAAPVFSGWMIASSPALNAMDDARYDVWVLRCKTS